MFDPERLNAACETARADLLAERTAEGHWVGELASSPLSTATAVCALVLAEQHGRRVGEDYFGDAAYEGDLSELVVQSLFWLARHQNEDGGWGDTDRSLSNIATTMLVRAAFHLTGVPAKYGQLMDRSEAYVQSQGGIAGLRRRYGRDKTFAVPILTCCALAELIPWRDVPALPFEMACMPQSWYRFLRLPVVSYAIPALVAIGQAKYYHQKPLNPITRYLRKWAAEPSLEVLRRMQPESGGFLEATPLTSFVVMSLAGIGLAHHEVARRGVEFLLASVRSDGSWPIDTNLATWNTTLAINALAGGERESENSDRQSTGCLDWLLKCQHTLPHPYTGAEPGGWAWTDLSGGAPDADDTSGALLALAAMRRQASLKDRERIWEAATQGLRWLVGLQNRNGGWPTFCRGWGKLPFDRSGADLTAHALRALAAWKPILMPQGTETRYSDDVTQLVAAIDRATDRGLRYLSAQQRPDGSWAPLWFGNQHFAAEENPIYGTARVLMAYRDLELLDSPHAARGVAWLVEHQQTDGGWGGGAAAMDAGLPEQQSTTEETSLAVEALSAVSETSAQVACEQGLAWLVREVEAGRYRTSSPIGFYFAKLWYYERLYPLTFAASALCRAAASAPPSQPTQTTNAHVSGA